MQFKRALQHTIAWKSLNTVLAFCINLLLVRIFGAAESGDFFYALTLLAFVTLVASWSLESGITYHGSNDPENIPAITIFLVPWLILQSFIIWWVLTNGAIDLDPRFSWLFIFTNLIITYVSALFYARKWVFAVNIIACISNAFVLVLLLVNYFKVFDFAQVDNGSDIAGNPSLWAGDRHRGAMIIYFAGFVLQALMLVIVLLSRLRLRWAVVQWDPALMKKIFVYSSIAFASNLLFFLVTRIDYYFVQRFCDEVALSNYVQVSKIGQVLVLLPTMMAAVVFPYSSGGDQENYLEKLQLLCRGITMLFIPIVIIAAACGFWAFPWLFGDSFQQMYVASLWYLPGFYCLSLIILLTSYLLGKSMLKADLLASLVALVIVVGCDLLWIPTWGINGAAAASSTAYFSCLCVLLLIFKNKFGAGPGNFFLPTRSDFSRFRNLE